MERIFSEILKTFTHLLRDILTYLLTGYIVIFDLYVIDYIYNNGKLFDLIPTNELIIISISAYIIGHICMAFYCLIFELTGFDEWFYMKVFRHRYSKVGSSLEISQIQQRASIYLKNKELYNHFVDRNAIMSLMRWNFSSAFFIIGLIHIGVCVIFKSINWILAFGVLALFISFALFVLSILTHKENNEQIKIFDKL